MISSECNAIDANEYNHDVGWFQLKSFGTKNNTNLSEKDLDAIKV